MKLKDSNEKVLTMITKMNGPEKIWVDKATEFAGECKKLCTVEGLQMCSTMSETKAAFADCTKTIPEKYTLPLHGR